MASFAGALIALQTPSLHAQQSHPASVDQSALQAAWANWLAAANLSSLEPAAAIDKLKQAPTQFQTFGDYHYWLGHYMQAAGYPPGTAAAEYELALLYDPDHAGAWFDYGLIQCRLGNDADCQSILDEARRRFGPLPGQYAAAQPVRPWRGEIRVGMGHSSNYNLGSDNQYIPIQIGDDAFKLELSPEYLPIAAFFSKVELDLAYQNVHHPQFSARASVQQRHPLENRGQLDNWYSANLDLTWQPAERHTLTLYSQDMHESAQDSFQGRGLRWAYLDGNVPFKLGASWGGSAAIERRRTEAAQPSYTSLLSQLRLNGSPIWGATLFATLGIEKDLPHEQRPGRGQARFYLAAAVAQANLLPGRGTAQVAVRLTDLTDSDPYSPLFGNVVRHNTQTDATLALSWPLWAQTILQAELRHFRQLSNLALFDQRETQFNLILGYRF